MCVRPSVCNVMLFIAKKVAKARAKQTVQSTAYGGAALMPRMPSLLTF